MKAKEDARDLKKTAAAGTVTWTTEQTNFITEAEKLRKAYADWITELAKN